MRRRVRVRHTWSRSCSCTEGAGMPGFDFTVPHISRVYDYWLGGKDNFAADRELGEQTRQAYPNIVYADNDPVVLTHARALLRGTPVGSLAYLDADLRYPNMILAEAAKTLDLKKPVAIMLLTVLQFVPDDEAYEVVERLTAACAPGSYLVISHPASDIEADRHNEMVRRMNESMPQKVTLRDHAGVTRMFDGLKLVEPGVVKASQWRPESDAQAATPTVLWAGVAGKP